jgi:hypothetical protein
MAGSPLADNIMKHAATFLLSFLPLVSLAADPSAGGPSAPETSGAGEDLAQQLANPIANLISVPLQSNLDFGIGPENATRYTLNIQPVVPFALNEDWNLVTRTIVPVIHSESPAPGVPSAFGLGDVVQSFFLSPKDTIGGWIVGGGPVALYSSATEDSLGTGKWGLGPTVVALKQVGPWTFGALANHLWSVAGDSDRGDVNATFLNPFASYVTSTKTTFTLSPELTYDWSAEQWLAPANLVVSQLFALGRQPIQVAFGGRYYFDAPSGGPEWGLRLSVVFLFPK